MVFAYHATGTLNIDGMAAAQADLFKGGALAFFLMLMAAILRTVYAAIAP